MCNVNTKSNNITHNLEQVKNSQATGKLDCVKPSLTEINRDHTQTDSIITPMNTKLSSV